MSYTPCELYGRALARAQVPRAWVLDSWDSEESIAIRLWDMKHGMIRLENAPSPPLPPLPPPWYYYFPERQRRPRRLLPIGDPTGDPRV